MVVMDLALDSGAQRDGPGLLGGHSPGGSWQLAARPDSFKKLSTAAACILPAPHRGCHKGFQGCSVMLGLEPDDTHMSLTSGAFFSASAKMACGRELVGTRG